MRLLISGALGAVGEVLPLVAVGAELGRRGHDVQFVGNPYFARAAADAGLSFVPVGSIAHQEALMADPGAFGRPRKSGLQLFDEHYFPRVQEYYRAIDALAAQHDSQVILGNEPAATTLAEKRRLPCVRLALSPARLASRCDPPHPERVLPWWQRAAYVGPGLAIASQWRRLRIRFAGPPRPGPLFGADHPFVLLRQRLGLPRASQSTYRPRLTLCLWPDWFGAPQPDWPAGATTVGFPTAPPTGPPVQLALFDDAPAPPIVATTGSLAIGQEAFFETVGEACTRLGVPGVLVTPHREQVPAALPRHLAYVEHAPFTQLFNRASLVIHHGGIGTTATALAAGIPQVVMPLRGEQFDSGSRVERLGVGRMLSAEATRAADLSRVVRSILGSAAVRRRCRQWRSRLLNEDGTRRAADLIEALR